MSYFLSHWVNPDLLNPDHKLPDGPEPAVGHLGGRGQRSSSCQSTSRDFVDQRQSMSQLSQSHRRRSKEDKIDPPIGEMMKKSPKAKEGGNHRGKGGNKAHQGLRHARPKVSKSQREDQEIHDIRERTKTVRNTRPI